MKKLKGCVCAVCGRPIERVQDRIYVNGEARHAKPCRKFFEVVAGDGIFHRETPASGPLSLESMSRSMRLRYSQ